jgi:hypothetical protein
MAHTRPTRFWLQLKFRFSTYLADGSPGHGSHGSNEGTDGLEGASRR